MEESQRKSCCPAALTACLYFSLIPTERSEVLIASWEEEWEVTRRKWKLVTSKIIRPDTCFQTASRSFWSPTRRTANSSSWTTELTAERSLKASASPRGKYHFSPAHFYPSFRLRIVQRCKELNVRLTNAQAKAKKESTEWALSSDDCHRKESISCSDSLLNRSSGAPDRTHNCADSTQGLSAQTLNENLLFAVKQMVQLQIFLFDIFL